MSAPYFVPLADLLPYWPHDLLAPSDVGMLGRVSQYVGVSDLDLLEIGGEVTLAGRLALWDELVFDLPLVEGVSLVLGKPGPNTSTFPFELSFGPATEPTGGVAEGALNAFLKNRLGPYELLLPQVDVGLRFDREDLRPMKPRDPSDLTKGFVPDPSLPAVQLNFRAALAINTDTGVRMEAPGDLDLPYCQIGSSGVVISARDIVFRLSDAEPLPEGIDPEEFDLEPDWKGVYLGRGTAYNLQALCDTLPALLDLEKWFIGGGGVTGRATATYDLHPDMTNQSFAVRAFRIAFCQNALIEGLVQAAVKLSFFDDKVVYLDLQITNEPSVDFPESVGFMGALSGDQPPGTEPPRPNELTGFDVRRPSSTNVLLHLGAKRLAVRSKPDLARADEDDLPPETRFWDILVDGRFEIDPSSEIGGEAVLGAEVTDLGFQVAPEFKLLIPKGLWVNLSESVRTRLAAFPVSISRVGVGQEDGEKWVGLDARVDFGTGIGQGAAIKGLRLWWGGPPGVHLSFEGIQVNVEKPGFSLTGKVTMVTGTDPGGVADPGQYLFRGDATVEMACGVGVKLEGNVLFGTKGGTRFGYLYLDATFGSGIPIFSSVSWFGAALLAAMNVAPNRALTGDHGDSFNYYQHWYTPAPGPFSISDSHKWVPQEDAWALGAGVSIGSSDGKAWSLKALLVVLSPGPVLLIEGRLRLLRTREAHTGPSSSTIRGLTVLDFDQGELLLALDVDYKLPASGLLFDLHAAGEVFYRHRPRDWHVAVGWPEPLERRVRAKALRLSEWAFYVVLSGSDLVLAERTFPATALAAGYRTGIDKRGKWGPIRGVFALWIAGDVALSFRPFYILAELSVHGEVSVKIYGIGFELMLDALMALEAPVGNDDLFFGGKLRVKVGLPWPLPDIKKDIPFSWGDASGMPPPITPLVDGATVSPGYSVVGRALFARETGPVAGTVLPLDGRIGITFQRPMRSTWAGAPTPVDLAAPDRVGDGYYRYTIVDVRVVVTPDGGPAHPAGEDVFGQWTLGPGDAQGPQAESLVLWGLTPFPAAGNLTWPGRTERRSWVDLLLDVYGSWPCGSTRPTERCVDFGIVPLGVYQRLRYQPNEAYGPVVFAPWPGAATVSEAATAAQVPLAVVETGDGRHCLRLARTMVIDGKDRTSGPVRDGTVVWGATVEVPPSLSVRGRVEHDANLNPLTVVASMGETVVATATATGADFELKADQPFNRVRIQLQPVRREMFPPGLDHLLCTFCYVTVGAVETAGEAEAQRGYWQHLLGPLTVDTPGTNANPWGGHLVHEPNATYDIELDVLTETADAVEGPWTSGGMVTERLSVRTAGPPADLTPYVQTLVPGDGEQPVYADYDLRITYNQPYVEAMYVKAHQPLTAELYTSNGRRVQPEVVRSRTVRPAISPETAVLLDHVREASCVGVDVDVLAGYDETEYRTRLATSTAYEARIVARSLGEPVYRWTFVTSRYRTFSEHVGDLRTSPWNERLAGTVDWTAVATTAGAAGGGDRDVEDDAWHTLWLEQLGLPTRVLPARPEVTLLWTGEAEGEAFQARVLSVVSPEPLFATDRTTVVVRSEAGPAGPAAPPVPCRVVRSRDGARTLVVPVDGAGEPIPLAAGDYRLDFTFRLTGVAGLPDLSRQGATADEAGSWPFRVPATPEAIVDRGA